MGVENKNLSTGVVCSQTLHFLLPALPYVAASQAASATQPRRQGSKGCVCQIPVLYTRAGGRVVDGKVRTGVMGGTSEQGGFSLCVV